MGASSSKPITRAQQRPQIIEPRQDIHEQIQKTELLVLEIEERCKAIAELKAKIIKSFELNQSTITNLEKLASELDNSISQLKTIEKFAIDFQVIVHGLDELKIFNNFHEVDRLLSIELDSNFSEQIEELKTKLNAEQQYIQSCVNQISNIHLDGINENSSAQLSLNSMKKRINDAGTILAINEEDLNFLSQLRVQFEKLKQLKDEHHQLKTSISEKLSKFIKGLTNSYYPFLVDDSSIPDDISKEDDREDIDEDEEIKKLKYHQLKTSISEKSSEYIADDLSICDDISEEDEWEDIEAHEDSEEQPSCDLGLSQPLLNDIVDINELNRLLPFISNADKVCTALHYPLENVIKSHPLLPKENVFFEYTQFLLDQGQPLQAYRLDTEEEQLLLAKKLNEQKSHEVGLITLSNGDVIAFASVIEPEEPKRKLYLFDQLVEPFKDLNPQEMKILTEIPSLSESLSKKIKAWGHQYQCVTLFQHEVEEIGCAVPNEHVELKKKLSACIQDKRRPLHFLEIQEFEFIQSELMDSSLPWLNDLGASNYKQAKLSKEQFEVFETFIKNKYNDVRNRLVGLLNDDGIFKNLTENEIQIVKFWLSKLPETKMSADLILKLQKLSEEPKDQIKFTEPEKALIFETIYSENNRLGDLFLKQNNSIAQAIERSHDFEKLKKIAGHIDMEYVGCSSQRNMGNTSLLHAFTHAAMAWWALNKKSISLFKALLPIWNKQEIGSRNNIEAIQQWRKAPVHTLTNDAVIKARQTEEKELKLKLELKNQLAIALNGLGDNACDVLAKSQKFMQDMVSAFEEGQVDFSLQNIKTFFECDLKFLPIGKTILQFLKFSGQDRIISATQVIASFTELLSDKKLFAEIRALFGDVTIALLENKNKENVIHEDAEMSDLYFQNFETNNWLPQRLRNVCSNFCLEKNELGLNDFRAFHLQLLSTFANAPQAEKEISHFSLLRQKMNELNTHLNEGASKALLKAEFKSFKKDIDEFAQGADKIQIAKRLDLLTYGLDSLKNHAMTEMKQAFETEKTEDEARAIYAVYWDRACRWQSFLEKAKNLDDLLGFIQTEVALYANQVDLEALFKSILKLELSIENLVTSADLPQFFKSTKTYSEPPYGFLEKPSICQMINHWIAQVMPHTKDTYSYHGLMNVIQDWHALEQNLWMQEIDRIFEESIHQINQSFLQVQNENFESSAAQGFKLSIKKLNGIVLQKVNCKWMEDYILHKERELKGIAKHYDDTLHLYRVIQDDFSIFLKEVLFSQNLMPDTGERQTSFDVLLEILQPHSQVSSLSHFLELLPSLKNKISVQETSNSDFNRLKPFLIEKIKQTLKNTQRFDRVLSEIKKELNKKDWFETALLDDEQLKNELLRQISCKELLSILTKNSHFLVKLPSLNHLLILLQDMSNQEQEFYEKQLLNFLDVHILSHFKEISIEEGSYQKNQSKQYIIQFETTFLSTILSKLNTNNENWNQPGNHLVLKGKDTLYIDKDLKLPGVNLTIDCPEQILIDLQEFHIDVSGHDGLSVPVMAQRGVDGVNGNPGEDAGDVWIEGHVLPKMIVKAYGGKGSNGQDGGQGENGQNGWRPEDLKSILQHENQSDINHMLIELLNKATETQNQDFSFQFSMTSTRVLSATLEVIEVDDDTRIIHPGPGGEPGKPGEGGVHGKNGKITIKHGANFIKQEEIDSFQHAPSLPGKLGKAGLPGQPLPPAQKIYAIFDRNLWAKPGKKPAWFEGHGRLLLPRQTFDVNHDEFVFETALPDPGEYCSFIEGPVKDFKVIDSKGRVFKINVLNFGYHLPPSQKKNANAFFSFFSTLFSPNSSHQGVLEPPRVNINAHHDVLELDINQETQADADLNEGELTMQLQHARPSSGIFLDACPSVQVTQESTNTPSLATKLLDKVSTMLGLSSHSQANHLSLTLNKTSTDYHSQVDLTSLQQKNLENHKRMESINAVCMNSIKHSNRISSIHQQALAKNQVIKTACEEVDEQPPLNPLKTSFCSFEQIQDVFIQRQHMDYPKNINLELPERLKTSISTPVLERLKKTHIDLWGGILEEAAYNQEFMQFIANTHLQQDKNRVETVLYYFNRVRITEKERYGDDANRMISHLMALISTHQYSIEIIHLLAKVLYRNQVKLTAVIELVTREKNGLTIEMIHQLTQPLQQTTEHRKLDELITIIQEGVLTESGKNQLKKIQECGHKVQLIIEEWKNNENEAKEQINFLLNELRCIDKNERDMYVKENSEQMIAALLFQWQLTSKQHCCPFEKLTVEQFDLLKPMLNHEILLKKLDGLNHHNYTKAKFTAEEYGVIKKSVNADFPLVEPVAIFPRDTQLLSLLLMIHKNELCLDVKDASEQQGMFQQINTGEGKTLIVALISAWFGLSGKLVDVVSSNRDLAIDGLEKCSAFFSSLGLNSACNESNRNDPELYENPIVYGTVESFKSARLEEVSGEGVGTGKRYPGLFACDPHRNILIADECDSLSLDKANDVLYLSHESEMMKKLDIIFSRIWALVQIQASENKSEAINSVAQNVMDDLALVIDEFDTDLKTLIDEQLETWVENAFTALQMQPDEYFTVSGEQITIVDKDTGTEQHTSRWGDALSIFLDMRFNRKTSSESLRAIFLSLKKFFGMYGHQVCGLSGTLGDQQSRDCSKKLYGVASIDIPTSLPKNFRQEDGKVATTREQWIKNLVASALERAKKGPVFIVCDSMYIAGDVEKDQLAVGDESALAGMIQQEIERQQLAQACKIHTYVKEGDDVEKKFNAQHPASVGDIIITTNKGGRGTDIKVDKKLIDKGIGLHVIMSFIPKNIRIEEQGFGRASRNGEPGSGEFNIQVKLTDLCGEIENPNHDATIEKLRLLRDAKEAERLIELPLEVLKKQVEEKLLNGFLTLTKDFSEQYNQQNVLDGGQDHYEGLFCKLLREQNLADFEEGDSADILHQGMAVYKDILKDKWAWWLKKQETAISKIRDAADEQILITKFKQEWSIDKIKSKGSVFEHLQELHATSDHFIRFGHYYASNGSYACAQKMFLEAQRLGDKTGSASTALAYCKVKLNQSATRKQKQAIRKELKNSYADLKKRFLLLKSDESYHVQHFSDSKENKHSLVSQYASKAQILRLHLSNLEQFIGPEFEISDFQDDSADSEQSTHALYKLLMQRGMLQAPILRAHYRKESSANALSEAISTLTLGNPYLSKKLSEFLRRPSHDKFGVQTFEQEQLEDFVCSNEECMKLFSKSLAQENETDSIFSYEIDLMKAQRLLPHLTAEGTEQAWKSFCTKLGITADFETIQIHQNQLQNLIDDKDSTEMNQLITFLKQNGCLRTKARLKYSQLELSRFLDPSSLSSVEDKYLSLRYNRQDSISIEFVHLLPDSVSDACQNRIYLKKNSEKNQYQYALNINGVLVLGAFSADEFEDSLDEKTLQNLMDTQSDVTRRLRSKILKHIQNGVEDNINIVEEINSFKNYVFVLKEEIEQAMCPVELQVDGAEESSSLKHIFLYKADQLSLDLLPEDIKIVEESSDLNLEIKTKIKQQWEAMSNQNEDPDAAYSFNSIQCQAIATFLKNKPALAKKMKIGRWGLSYCCENEDFVEKLKDLTQDEFEEIEYLIHKDLQLGAEQKKKLLQQLKSDTSQDSLSSQEIIKVLKDVIALSPSLKTRYLLSRKHIYLTATKHKDVLNILHACSLHQVALKNNNYQFKKNLLNQLPQDIREDMISDDYLLEHPYFYMDELPFQNKTQEAAKLMAQLKEARIIKFGGLGLKYKYENQSKGNKTSLVEDLEKLFLEQPISINRNVFKKALDVLKSGVGFIRELGADKEISASYISFKEMARLSEDEQEPGELNFFSPVHQHRYLSLEEKKESNLWTFVMVSVLAIFQLIAGALLIVVLPNIAMSLIGEGVGDIIQLAIAIKTGDMSLKDYWHGKLIGLTLMGTVGFMRFLSKLTLVTRLINGVKSSHMAQVLKNFAGKTKNAFVNFGNTIKESEIMRSFSKFCSNTVSWTRNAASNARLHFKTLLHNLKGSIKTTARVCSTFLSQSSLYQNVVKYGQSAVNYLKSNSMIQLISSLGSKSRRLLINAVNALFSAIKDYGIRVIKFFRGSLARDKNASKGVQFLKGFTLEAVSQGAVTTLEEVFSRRILERVSQSLSSMMANIHIQREKSIEKLRERLINLRSKNPLSFKNACRELCEVMNGKEAVLPLDLKHKLEYAARCYGLAMRSGSQMANGLANMLRMASQSLALAQIGQELSSINHMITDTFESIIDAYDACGEKANTSHWNKDDQDMLDETMKMIKDQSNQYIEQHVHSFLQIQLNHHVSMGINHYFSVMSRRSHDRSGEYVPGKVKNEEHDIKSAPASQAKSVKPQLTLSLDSPKSITRSKLATHSERFKKMNESKMSWVRVRKNPPIRQQMISIPRKFLVNTSTTKPASQFTVREFAKYMGIKVQMYKEGTCIEKFGKGLPVKLEVERNPETGKFEHCKPKIKINGKSIDVDAMLSSKLPKDDKACVIRSMLIANKYHQLTTGKRLGTSQKLMILQEIINQFSSPQKVQKKLQEMKRNLGRARVTYTKRIRKLRRESYGGGKRQAPEVPTNAKRQKLDNSNSPKRLKPNPSGMHHCPDNTSAILTRESEFIYSCKEIGAKPRYKKYQASVNHIISDQRLQNLIGKAFEKKSHFDAVYAALKNLHDEHYIVNVSPNGRKASPEYLEAAGKKECKNKKIAGFLLDEIREYPSKDNIKNYTKHLASTLTGNLIDGNASANSGIGAHFDAPTCPQAKEKISKLITSVVNVAKAGNITDTPEYSQAFQPDIIIKKQTNGTYRFYVRSSGKTLKSHQLYSTEGNREYPDALFSKINLENNNPGSTKGFFKTSVQNKQFDEGYIRVRTGSFDSASQFVYSETITEESLRSAIQPQLK